MKKKPRFDFGETTESAQKALDLLKPRREPGTADDASLAEWAMRALLMEQFRRLFVIAEHYGMDLSSIDNIDPSKPHGWTLIALCLASDFVPGFNPLAGAKRGRSRSAMRDNLDLVMEIRSIVKEGERSVANACEILSKRNGNWKGEAPANLEAKYYRFFDALTREQIAISDAVAAMCRDNARSLSALGSIYGLSRDGATE